jgi:hypothetical protein
MSAGAAEAPAVDPIALVEARGATGAARVDPVALAVIEALARRATAQQGEARRLLMRRVEELQAEHAAAKPPGTPNETAPNEPEVRRAVLAGLTRLVDQLDRAPTSTAPPRLPPPPGTARQTDSPRTASPSRTASPASLKAVTEFKGTWSRLRAEQRLRQALAQVPTMAGPLNSSHVMNRTLQAMRDLSPEYLEAFMQHVDALQWLDQAAGGTIGTPRPAPQVEGRRGPGARSTRKN